MFFFFNDTATTEIYTLSLHDALPIYTSGPPNFIPFPAAGAAGDSHEAKNSCAVRWSRWATSKGGCRSEEHTSELQSRPHLVCRLLLEKKKKMTCNEEISETQELNCGG